MVKKLKALAKSDDKQLANAVRSSAQQIWQAGLGAFAKAQEEGGKVFSKLVKEGTELQKRTQKLAEDKVSGVSDTVSKVTESITKQASGSWDKLEQVFEDRVSRSLTSLGVPSKKDIQALTKRVEELSLVVAALSAKKTAVVKTTANKAAPTKATAKAAPKASAKANVKTAPNKNTAKLASKTKTTAEKKPALKAVTKATTKPAAKPATKKTVTKTAASTTPVKPANDAAN